MNNEENAIKNAIADMMGSFGIDKVIFADDNGNEQDFIETNKPKSLTVALPKINGGTIKIKAGDRVKWAHVENGNRGHITEGIVINITEDKIGGKQTEAYNVPTQRDDGGIDLILAPVKGYSWRIEFEKCC